MSRGSALRSVVSLPSVGLRATGRSGRWLVVATGLAASCVSLARMALGDPSALARVLWAEDGLFPLCVRKAGLLECLVQPFAGYFLGVPRVLAGVTALVPAEQWALAANLLAAGSVGVLAGLTAWWVLRAGLHPLTAALAGLVLVALPIAGIEAVNAIGSLYMPLLALTAFVVAMPGPEHRSGDGLAMGLLGVSALTSPLTIVLAPFLALQWIRGSLSSGRAIRWSLALVAGSTVQVAVIVAARGQRSMGVTPESIVSAITQFTGALLTFVPGLALGTTRVDGTIPLPLAPGLPWIVLAVLGSTSLALAARRSAPARTMGILGLVAIASALLPAATGAASNRYYVAPAMMLALSALIGLDSRWSRLTDTVARRLALACVFLVIAAVWWPMIPASYFRSQPNPPWTEELERARAVCELGGAFATVRFTPVWPSRWLPVREPTTSRVECDTAQPVLR